ncbi:hypothetical protein BGX28_007538 [Mortierella sp. GBA30]|nr:hypothetical protein BGX28_007538 [Mortierella sp. GBA30]
MSTSMEEEDVRIGACDSPGRKGLFHVKIYIKRRNKHRLEITRKETKLMSWKKTLEDRLNMRLTLDGPEKPGLTENDTLTKRQVLKRDQNECLDLIKRATRPTMQLKQFTTIAEASVYEGPEHACKEKPVRPNSYSLHPGGTVRSFDVPGIDSTESEQENIADTVRTFSTAGTPIYHNS